MINTDNFYVVTAISNPIRYRRRYRLFEKFREMCHAGKVKLITVEMAFGEREFNVTRNDNPYDIQLRSVDELWHKENMINIGVQHLMRMDPKAKKVAWIDADVAPCQPPERWFYETAQALEHYEIVQMWEKAQDLDHEYNFIGKQHLSFMAAYVKSGYRQPSATGMWDLDYYTRHGHPGYAWAANIDALNKVGGLFDVGILGSGDRNMACSLIGSFEHSMPEDCTAGYRNSLALWQEKAERWIKRDVGYVPGSINHYWHGNKRNRFYQDRWKILIHNQYDPATDLKRDAQGLYQLETWSPRQALLRDELRSYFKARNEDAISETSSLNLNKELR